MSVTIKYPHDLLTTLATMKSAKEKGVGMNIWDRDIKAVEDAIATLAALTAADPAIARTEQEMHDLGLSNAPRGAAEALVKAVRGSESDVRKTAEAIARDTSCAQGEFHQRVKAIIPYLTNADD